MTTQEKLIQRKLSLLELAEYLKNVSEACRLLGVSRQHFYDIKQAFAAGGLEALREKNRHKPNVRNRAPAQVEDAVCAFALEQPAYGQVRVANELKKRGITVSAAGVRCIWLRHNLESRKKRLKALEAQAAREGWVYTEAQLQALEQAQRERETEPESLETHHPGYLLAQDTMYVGHLKGVGRIYQQTVLDTYSSVAFAKLYTTKQPVTAADLLHDRVLPFFAVEQVPVLRVLTDRGTEFCGRADQHPYELFLQLEEIDHTKTRTKRPQTNGICERFHRTVQEEFYFVAFRKTIYRTLEAVQQDLDAWLTHYNSERTHQGVRCQGRTPLQTFLDSRELAWEKKIA
jgi:transposase InsO family protein